MKIIKSYSTRVEADLARIALEAADVPAIVVGIGLGVWKAARGVCSYSCPRIVSKRR